MAVAGRVAIRPRGAFDIETSYERLDMVKYQNTLFIAKKAVSGVVPAEGEFWMDCGGTELSDIEKKITSLEAPEFTEAEELEELESKKTNGTLWGRVAKAVSSLIAHLGNKENPHEVTAAQTGALTKDNILNSTVATEAGQAAADAVQLNKEVEGSYAAGVAEELSGINADLSKSFKNKGGFVGNIDNLRRPADNGVYYINSTIGTIAGDVPGFEYYFLSVMMSSDNTGVQIAYVAAYNNQSTLGRFAVRTYINNQWYDWLYFDSDIVLEKKLNSYAKNEMIPYLFQYSAAKQPVFVLSTSNDDTMYMGDRGCKRNSSTKALIIKSENDGFCSYGILSPTKEGIECTALTEQGGTIYVGAYASPKGNTIYFCQMQTRYTASTNLPVVATVNGMRQEIEQSCFNYRNADMRLFAFIMADHYLFNY